MSDRPVSLLIVDKDAIFRLGLATVLRNYPQWNIIVETDSLNDALTQFSSNTFSLVILDPILTDGIVEIAEFYQQVKQMSPKTKLCLLSYYLSIEQQQEFKRIGIEGYCNKGINTEDLISNLQKIEEGKSAWSEIVVNKSSQSLPKKSQKNLLFRWQTSGIYQIDSYLQDINKKLKKRPISKVDRLFLQGRKRELLTARWLVENILPVEVIMVSYPVSNAEIIDPEKSTIFESDGSLSLLNQTAYNIEKNLDNVSQYALEIDILKPSQKQEILEIILNQFNRIINDLKFIESPNIQLSRTSLSILERLWRESAVIFLSKYCIDNRSFSVEDIENLVEDKEELISSEILDKIPCFTELLDFIVLGSNEPISAINDGFGNLNSINKEDKILHNVIIQIANAITSLILNDFSDKEKIKENLYHIEMASSREIAKFRNRLAWEYRKRQYWQEPKNIFESQYEIFFFRETGIHCTSIYAPRQQELKSLQGIPWAVTILLESRDAISPLLRSVVGTVGQGLIYVLTQVIGRGIGLVGRGILQGIGKSLSDKEIQKNSREHDSRRKSKL
ncbi:MAG: DUF3685 domain-containing protein [Crocosphaera sp.]|nr:DUF3685 domain-containing protein [Crocosphaera sp.]